MKHAAALMALFIALPLAAHAECSIDQRIELAKAGYDKAEVDELCAASQPAAAEASPLDVLKAAPFVIPDDNRWRKGFPQELHCEFIESSVKVNNNKKTFGGFYSKVIDYKHFIANDYGQSFNVNTEKGVIDAMIMITAYGLTYANESCYALRIFHTGITPEDMPAVEARYRQDYDAVISALADMGVEIRD